MAAFGVERKISIGEMYRRQSRFQQHRQTYRKRMKQWHEERCGCCGTLDNIQIDHVVPTSMGGINHIVNLQFLCRRCNRAKGIEYTDYRNPMVVRIMHLVYFQKVISTVDLEHGPQDWNKDWPRIPKKQAAQ